MRKAIVVVAMSLLLVSNLSAQCQCGCVVTKQCTCADCNHPLLKPGVQCTTRCVCGCTVTKQCTCVDCDHPQITKKQGLAPQSKATAKIILHVKGKSDRILIDDALTKSTGFVREYDTPPLEAGKEFEYTITNWSTHDQRVISVRAGHTTEVFDLLVPAIDRTYAAKGTVKGLVAAVESPEDVLLEIMDLRQQQYDLVAAYSPDTKDKFDAKAELLRARLDLARERQAKNKGKP